MSVAFMVFVVADVIVFTPEPVDRHQVAAQYATQCSGAQASGADCTRLKWQLEEILYEDLRAGAKVKRETWRVAAMADVPKLAVIGLRKIGQSYTPDDDAIVAAQLDSPFPSVREAAFALVDRMATDRFRRMRVRRQSDPIPTFPVADEIPDAGRLGAAPYPGAGYRTFASDARRAFFTTDDPPEKVAAFYSKGGRRALSADELKAEQKRRKDAVKAASRDPQAMAAKMQAAIAAGKDPRAAMMEMSAQMGGSDKNWVNGLATAEGVTNPKFVPLDDAMSRMLLVFRDEILGQTAIVFLDLPTGAELAMQKPDPTQMTRWTEAQRVLTRPLIDDGDDKKPRSDGNQP